LILTTTFVPLGGFISPITANVVLNGLYKTIKDSVVDLILN